MNRSTISNYILVFFLAVFAFSACEKIDEPFTRKISQPDPDTTDTTDTVVHFKRVLLEDYTGHTCVNCPEAALLAHDLKTFYGEKLVLLAVHAGWFAKTTPLNGFTSDYTTEIGDKWDTYFGISNAGNPNGMVNRKGFPSAEHILSPAGWSSAIEPALNEPLLVDVTLENAYDTTSRKLTVTATTEFLGEVNRNLNLMVVLTESGVVSPQKNNKAEIGPVPIITDYVHNHILRGDINGLEGTPVAVTDSSHPDVIEKTFNHTIDGNFNAQNCTVVAFIYDVETQEILQAAELQVIAPEEK